MYIVKDLLFRTKNQTRGTNKRRAEPLGLVGGPLGFHARSRSAFVGFTTVPTTKLLRSGTRSTGSRRGASEAEVAACRLAVGRWQQGAPQPSPAQPSPAQSSPARSSRGSHHPTPQSCRENLPGTTAHAGSPGAVRPLTTASRCRSLDYERFMQILSQRHLQRGAEWRKAEGYRGSSLTPLQRTGCTFIHPAVHRSIHPPVYAWPADAGSVSVQLSGQRRRQGN